MEKTKPEISEVVTLDKKPYTAPHIDSQEVLEQAALSCDHSAFYNPWTNTKEGASTCGYADS